MNKLEIGAQAFGDSTACMGTQLGFMLHVLGRHLFGTWWVFDVYGSTYADLQQLFPEQKHNGAVFYHTAALIENVMQVVQFETGVFCLLQASSLPSFRDGIPSTESLEGMQIEQAMVEIRTFDNSYFEVYAADEILHQLVRSFSTNKGICWRNM